MIQRMQVLQKSASEKEAKETPKGTQRRLPNRPGLARPSQAWSQTGWAWLAWPGLVWPGLVWPGLVWPGGLARSGLPCPGPARPGQWGPPSVPELGKLVFQPENMKSFF